jgi:hypothetical protein
MVPKQVWKWKEEVLALFKVFLNRSAAFFDLFVEGFCPNIQTDHPLRHANATPA